MKISTLITLIENKLEIKSRLIVLETIKGQMKAAQQP